MIKATAPGKIYLFGEHAVVYGYPAIACAINKRTEVEAEKTRNKDITIIPKNLSFKSIKFSFGDENRYNIPKKELKSLEYIRKSIKKILDKKDQKIGLKLKINSELPISGGLGSSASVTVATIFSLKELLDLDLSRREVANLAYEVEKDVQGNASPCDTFTSALGGLTKVEKNKELIKNKAPAIPIIIGYTNQQSNTTKLVEEVKELKNKYPTIINNLFNNIKKITEKGQKALEKKNLEEIGNLMNINQGILDSIGVNNLKLSKLIYVARESGSYGSKITGAGGGGCMIAITENKEKVSNAIKVTGGKAIKTKLTNEGVKIT